jgi:hypothetical protein
MPISTDGLLSSATATGKLARLDRRRLGATAVARQCFADESRERCGNGATAATAALSLVLLPIGRRLLAEGSGRHDLFGAD